MAYQATRRIKALALGREWEAGQQIGDLELFPHVRDALLAEGAIVPVEAVVPARAVVDPEGVTVIEVTAPAPVTGTGTGSKARRK